MEYERGEIKINCKSEKVFAFLSYALMKKYYSIKKGERYVKDRKIRLFERVLAHIKNKIEDFLIKFEKEFSQAIKEDRIIIETNYKDKGGEIIIRMEGTKDEMDEWMKIRWRDKFFMKMCKKWIEFEIRRV